MFFIFILLSYVLVEEATKKVAGLSRNFLRGGGMDGWKKKSGAEAPHVL